MPKKRVPIREIFKDGLQEFSFKTEQNRNDRHVDQNKYVIFSCVRKRLENISQA